MKKKEYHVLYYRYGLRSNKETVMRKRRHFKDISKEWNRLDQN